MEIFTLVTGVCYVILEIRQKNFMWYIGMLTSLTAMYMFFTEGLYASFLLNCYYFAMAFWGLWQWKRDTRRLRDTTIGPALEPGSDAQTMGESAEESEAGVQMSGKSVVEDKASWNVGERNVGEQNAGTTPQGGDVIHLNRLSLKTALLCCLAFVAGLVALRLGLKALNDPMSGLDAAVAVLSAVATFMLARSYIQQWLLWMVADLMSTILCAVSGMYWMTALYAVYALSAVYGYIYWRRRGVYIGS